jgi:hypothetical protein
VLAACTDDVVRVAGGWLCDLRLAGWEVNVVTADHDDDQRALRILGVRGHDLDVDVDVNQVDPAHPHPARVHTAEPGARHVSRPELRTAQVGPREPRFAQVRFREVSHGLTLTPDPDNRLP